MFFIISSIFFIQVILLWILLIESKKLVSDEERFIEDNLQMKYLKEFSIKKNNFNKFL